MERATIDLIHHHGSVRQYKPEPVPADLLETIVVAAQRSSTSSNMQRLSVVAVTDDSKRKRLAELCGQAFIADAPIFLTWCADLSRLDRVCELRGYKQVTEFAEDFLVAAVDAAIAAQTASLAAESLGLGICFIGTVRDKPQAVIDLLALPRLVFPITGMTVGWPAKTPIIRPRLPTSAVLHWEVYHRDQDRELLEYDRAMMMTGIYEDRQVPVPGRPAHVNDYGWLEHSARRVSQARRTELRAVLERQGFRLK